MNRNDLYILWTNDNPITSEHMVMMYSKNAMLKKWWDKITVIIWGASSRLVAENTDIQKCIIEAKAAGVEFSACISCATKLGTVNQLTDLGIELKGWGQPLTDLIKEEKYMITV